jgi:hypothetical protein
MSNNPVHLTAAKQRHNIKEITVKDILTKLKESFQQKKVFWVVLAILGVTIVIFSLSLGYYYYASTKTENDKKNEQVGDTQYPEKTIIEDTEDPNVKKITPSRNDTVQVQTESGDTIAIPVYTPPPKE